jgi:hypothetical protein
VTNCTANHSSYKSLSFLSDYSDEINMQYYNYLNSSGFTYNLILTKSPFYKYVVQRVKRNSEREKRGRKGVEIIAKY